MTYNQSAWVKAALGQFTQLVHIQFIVDVAKSLTHTHKQSKLYSCISFKLNVSYLKCSLAVFSSPSILKIVRS